MTPEELKDRTKQYAVRVVRLVATLPNTSAVKVMGHQLLRSATSMAANYRADCRARSRAEFLSKLGIVEEEADDSPFWQELLAECGIVKELLLKDLMHEGQEILSIIVASRKTARNRRASHDRNGQRERSAASLGPGRPLRTRPPRRAGTHSWRLKADNQQSTIEDRQSKMR